MNKPATPTYSRTQMAALLSALPREEQQWTYNLLRSIIFRPENNKNNKQSAPEDMPQDLLMTALSYAEESVNAGDCVRNEDIEDFVAKEMGWN